MTSMSSSVYLKTFTRNFLLLACLCLPSCTPPDIPMKLGTNLWLGYEPFYLASKKDYLNSHQVHLVEYTSASQVIMAYRNGAIDAAALTLDEALLLQENQFNPKIILILDMSNGADAILGQPEITRFEQLKGKRIGVEDTALGAYVLSRALAINNMSLNDVSVVSLEMDKHERAFESGKIDAVVTFEPIKSKLLANSANILFDSTKIPNEIVDTLVVSQRYYQKHQKNIDAIRLAWFQALQFIKSNSQRAIDIMRTRQKLGFKEFKKAYSEIYFPNKMENSELLNPNNDKSIYPISKKLAEIMFNKKLLHRKIDTRKLFINR